MDNEVLTKRVGGRQRKLFVKNIEIKEVLTREQVSADKLILTCVSLENQEFLIDEALLVDTRDEEIKSKGLWVSTDGEGHIRAKSVIARMLQHYNVTTPQELVDQEITALPKRNNYLAIVIDSQIEDSTLPW